MANKFFWQSSLVLLLVSGLTALLHFVALSGLNLDAKFTEVPVGIIYLVVLPVTWLSILFVSWRYSKDKTSAGRSFFISVFVKIFVITPMLYPDNLVPRSHLKFFAAQFLVVFFILLFVETYLLVRLLNQVPDEKNKNDENQ